jgi:hypothetical protein
MPPNLTSEQRRAIEGTGGKPVYLVDADTHTAYVLLRADQYESIKALIEEEEFDPRSTYPLVDETFRQYWDDPAMDVYDDYDAHRQKP